MSAWGLQLITSILTAENPREAYEYVVDVKGIEPKHLLNVEARVALEFMKTWYERPLEFGRVPSKQRVEEQLPQLILPTPKEPLEDLAETVKTEFLRQQLLAAHEEFGLLIAEEPSPFEALEFMRSRVAQIDEQHVIDNDMDFSAEGPKIVADYLKRIKENDGLLGIPWPWKELNHATQGIQPSDLIVFYGLPKSMKTWLVLYLATFLVDTGHRVLVFSREMTATTMSLRCTSILAKLAYSRLRAGDLNLEEYNRLIIANDKVQDVLSPGKLTFTKASKADGSPGGVSDIHRKILRYRPHLVILDSAYMMTNDRAGSHSLKWGDLAAISQDVKQMASSSGVPTIMIWQENEAKAMKFKGSGARGTASLAMASQLIYYCDMAVRCILHPPTQEMSLQFAATREFQFDGFTIHAKPGYNFEFSKWEMYDVAEKPQEPTGHGGTSAMPGVDELTAIFKQSITGPDLVGGK